MLCMSETFLINFCAQFILVLCTCGLHLFCWKHYCHKHTALGIADQGNLLIVYYVIYCLNQLNRSFNKGAVMEERRFYCTHQSCNHRPKGTRFAFQHEKTCNRHEREVSYHRACDATCAACKRWASTTTNKVKRQIVERPAFICGHTNDCNRPYQSLSNLNHHELHEVHTGCQPGCSRCAAKERSWKARKAKKEAEEAIRQEKESQERKEDIAHTIEAVANAAWDAVLNATSAAEFQRKKAEVN